MRAFVPSMLAIHEESSEENNSRVNHLVVLPTNISITWIKLARYKLSGLLCRAVSYKREKKFYNIFNRTNWTAGKYFKVHPNRSYA